MSDDLRAAAERLREYVDAGGEFEADAVEPTDEMSDWRDTFAQGDLWALARAYLASHPAPSPVTAEGLVALGFVQEPDDDETFRFRFGTRLLTVQVIGDDPADVVWSDERLDVAILGTARDLADVALLVEAQRRLNGGAT